MLNDISLQGRLVKDPELRYTKNEKAFGVFTLACERDRKDAAGNRTTDFFDCIAWGAAAEFVNKYFHKGDMMIINGRLETRKWTDKDGNNRLAYEINAFSTYFCGGSNKKDEKATFVDVADDGDLPF